MSGPHAAKQACEFFTRRGLMTQKGKLTNAHQFIGSLANLTLPQLVEIAEEATAIFRLSDREAISSQKENPVLTHRASFQLGGSPQFHSQAGCRIHEVGNLSRFALLYSDRVYINNFFGRYHHIVNADNSPVNRQTVRQWLVDDLFVFQALRPLLLDGKVVMISPPSHTCAACWSVRSLGKGLTQKVERLVPRLSRDFLKKATFTIRRSGSEYELAIHAPEYFAPHSDSIRKSLYALPDSLAGSQKLLRKLETGESVTLSAAAAARLDYHQTFAEMTVQNVSFDMLASRLTNSSFVTGNKLDIDLITTLAGNREIERRNRILHECLTSQVPFLEDWNVKSLIELRRREAESFARFRRALNSAIVELSKSGSTLDESIAAQLYGDVVAPRLKELDQRVRIARRTLLKGVYRPVVALVGVISIGMFGNLIPGNLAELVKILGVGKASYDILQSGLATGDARESIEEHDFYFLWRVKEDVRKRR